MEYRPFLDQMIICLNKIDFHASTDDLAKTIREFYIIHSAFMNAFKTMKRKPVTPDVLQPLLNFELAVAAQLETETEYYDDYDSSDYDSDSYGSSSESDDGIHNYDDNEYDAFGEDNDYWDMYDAHDYQKHHQHQQNDISRYFQDKNTGELYDPGFFNRDYSKHGAHHGEYHKVTPDHEHGYDFMAAFNPHEKKHQDLEFFEDFYGYGEHAEHELDRHSTLGHHPTYVNAGGDQILDPGFFNRDYSKHGVHHGEYHKVTPDHKHGYDFMSAFDPHEKKH